MNKLEAKKRILEYFKKNAIDFKYLNETDLPISLEFSDTIYLCAEVPDVLGNHIETCLRFKEEHLYCQSYYCQPVVDNEEQAIRAARIVNYLNMHLSYDCDSLYEHSFIFDEDRGDIFNGCLIRYELMEMYFYETINHILNYGVQQISDVCRAILFYVHGKWDYFQATKKAIDYELMGKTI